MCQTDVEFEQIDMKISKKNVQVLERYGQGALARRETNKMKIQCIKQIAGKCSKQFIPCRSSLPVLLRRWNESDLIRGQKAFGRRGDEQVSKQRHHRREEAGVDKLLQGIT